MNKSTLLAVTMLLALGLVACATHAQEQAETKETAMDNGWTQLDRRGFNSICCDRATGDLYISNGKVVNITRDGGATWEEPVERAAKGRHYNSTGWDSDWRGGRLALFPIDNPVGWMTLDGGKTWTTFAKPTPPQVGKHDGWTYGAVHWADDKPTRLFGKEHHTTNLWLSTDAGVTWSKIDGIGGYFGIGFGTDGALLVGATIDKRTRLPVGAEKGGVYRSADDGKTWELVFEAELGQKVKPRTFEDTVYWPTLQGLAVSKDGGTTWAMMDGSPKACSWGPIFGETGDDMIVVNQEGVHKTTDGGETWTQILTREQLPKPVKDGNYKEIMPNFAWDWKTNTLYATSVGVPLFKLSLGE